QLVMERRSIDAELAAADAPLAALRDVRQEMRTVESMIVGLNEARRARGEALAALARVSAAVPDSTVVTSYTWRGDGSGLVAGAGSDGVAADIAGPRRDVVAGTGCPGTAVVVGIHGSRGGFRPVGADEPGGRSCARASRAARSDARFDRQRTPRPRPRSRSAR